MANILFSLSSILDAAIPPEILRQLMEKPEETSSSFFSAWVIWVIVALFFIIFEIFTAGFAVACFSVGAVAAAIGAALGLGLAWQLVLFSVFTIVAFVTVRPFMLKHFYKSDEAQRKSNVDALIGRTAKVTEEINNAEGKGRVAIDGDDWRAISSDAAVIAEGEKVRVEKVESIVLTVSKL